MTPTSLKILVFVSEYFIALDIQRALAEMPESHVDIVQRHDIADALAAQPFDLAVIGLSKDLQENAKNAAAVERSGGALVFTSGFSPDSLPLAGSAPWPIVEIPFVDEALHHAASQALKLRSQLNDKKA
ncbi:hypothetical protein [Rhizobium halophytocola]|uniref:Response regulatory domain-containing protein n=1 Tax=Rhizobium halophytocola TaxID=735519 RepID=A0ABS4E0G6_9HYPH|nr:hypothetical protein [Rhizobium halophytocola]MBP1851433.1 hypothetical protein [Rhizobium halophytocola]